VPSLAPNTRKAELWGPASLCDVEPHARSGRSVGAARPFGLWTTRTALWFPIKWRRDPTKVLVLRRVCYDVASALAKLKPNSRGLVAQNTQATPPHGNAATPPDRCPLRLLNLRLEPPTARDDSGLACPHELPGCFPEPPNFFVGAFHNWSAHTQSIHETANATVRNATLFPEIHRERGRLQRSWSAPKMLSAPKITCRITSAFLWLAGSLD